MQPSFGSLTHDGVIVPPSCDRLLCPQPQQQSAQQPSVNSAIGMFLAELRKEKSLLAEGIELVSDSAMPPPNKRLRRTNSGSKFCRWDSNGSIANRLSMDSLPTVPGRKRDRDLSSSQMANFAWDTAAISQQQAPPPTSSTANYAWGVDAAPSAPMRRPAAWDAPPSFPSRQNSTG